MVKHHKSLVGLRSRLFGVEILLANPNQSFPDHVIPDNTSFPSAAFTELICLLFMFYVNCKRMDVLLNVFLVVFVSRYVRIELKLMKFSILRLSGLWTHVCFVNWFVCLWFFSCTGFGMARECLFWFQCQKIVCFTKSITRYVWLTAELYSVQYVTLVWQTV